MRASTKSTKNTAEDCRRGPPEGGIRAVSGLHRALRNNVIEPYVIEPYGSI
jgi:hypothetical protein